MEFNDYLILFCMLILIVLNVVVIIHGLNLSCDKCSIRFSVEKQSYKENGLWKDFMVNVTELYKSYLRSECLIKYHPQEGYIYDFTKIS